MKRLGSRRVKWIGGILAMSMMLVSFLANSVQTDQDLRKVATMTNKMKTLCVGRFLIDLPEDSQVGIQQGFVGGFNMSSRVRESDLEFEGRFARFEQEIGDPVRDIHPPRLESTSIPVIADARAKVVVYNRKRYQFRDEGRDVDVEDVSVQGILRIKGMTVHAKAEHRALDVGARLERTFRQIRPLGPEELPGEEGFCINRAIIRDPFEHKGNESVVLFAGIPGHPDVNIVFSSMAGTEPGPGLLERHTRVVERQPVFMRLAFNHLRESPRTVNGLTGDELVMRVREPNFTTGYSFQWESAGRQDDIYAALLKLELFSGVNPAAGGKPLQSTLSEEALFDLWERIITTIRVRPTVAAAESTQPPPGLALGTNAFAGEDCPCTGWWECADGGAGIGVFGGQRQFVRQGQRMPQALLLPPPTMWQRLRGVQPSYESVNPTIWALADRRATQRTTQLAGLEPAIPRMPSAFSPVTGIPAAHVETPIGSVVKTGAACPESGWWRCEESHALDGTRWFAAGSLLPAATFRAPQHGRGAGYTELIYRRSAWHLVRHAADAPSAASAFDATAGEAGPGGSAA